MKALIDGDVLAFRAAAAVQTNIDWDGDGDVVSDADPARAIKVAGNILDQWCQAVGASDHVIVQSDRRAPKTSFRYLIHPHYKAQRPSVKPLALKATEEWLRTKRGAFFYAGLEGDDAIGVIATDPDLKEAMTIVSTDKDMLTIPSRVFIVPHMRPLAEAAPRTISSVEANRNIYRQAITGDAVDNYKGAPGIGAKGAEKYLDNGWFGVMQAFEDAWAKAEKSEKLRAAWVNPGRMGAEALLNVRCAFILRHAYYRPGDDKPIRLWTPPSERREEWISPF